MQCPSCKSEQSENKICTSCQYPIQGKFEDKKLFIDTIIKEQEIYKQAKRTHRLTTYTLRLLIIVTLIFPLLSSITTGTYNNSILIYAMLSLLFTGLLFLSKKFFYTSVFVTLILLLTDLILSSMIDFYGQSVLSIYFKVAMIVALIYTLIKGWALHKLNQKYKSLLS